MIRAELMATHQTKNNPYALPLGPPPSVPSKRRKTTVQWPATNAYRLHRDNSPISTEAKH